MNYFLAKSEPQTYSIGDLEKDRNTVWDGVKNAQALKAIRMMKKGDRVFIYHSGGESRVVGLAEVRLDARPDPKDSKLTVVDLSFLRRLEPGVGLAEVKQSGLFADFALVRQGRLSTMAVPASFVEFVRQRHPGVKI